AATLARSVLGSSARVGSRPPVRGGRSPSPAWAGPRLPAGGEVVNQLAIDRDRFQAVMQLLVDHPELDADRLRALVESASGRRRRSEPVRPRSWSEITAAVEAGWVTKNEARKMAGLARRQGPPAQPRRD